MRGFRSEREMVRLGYDMGKDSPIRIGERQTTLKEQRMKLDGAAKKRSLPVKHCVRNGDHASPRVYLVFANRWLVGHVA